MENESVIKGQAFLVLLSDKYLWNPTISAYLITFAFWMFCKRKYSLSPISIAFFMTIPGSYDYLSKLLYQ